MPEKNSVVIFNTHFCPNWSISHKQFDGLDGALLNNFYKRYYFFQPYGSTISVHNQRMEILTDDPSLGLYATATPEATFMPVIAEITTW